MDYVPAPWRCSSAAGQVKAARRKPDRLLGTAEFAAGGRAAGFSSDYNIKHMSTKVLIGCNQLYLRSGF